MPSPKPGNLKTTQPQMRLTRRSFGSADSNNSIIDSITNNPDRVNDNNNDDNNNDDDKKNKGTLNNNSGSDIQQQSNNNDNNNNSYRSLWEKYDLSLRLENKASVARDHLANERTFLAWLRTSLSFISIGIAITQLFRLTDKCDDQRNDRWGKLLGIVFIILGILFLSFGVTRYFHSQYLMTKGRFPASRGSIVFGTLLTILVLVACFTIIIVNDTKNE